MRHAALATCAPDRVTVVIGQGGETYVVEIADTPAKQAQGLMFRTELAPDRGMLFIFPRPAPRAFWMRNTIISLDIIFVDATGAVLNVAERTTPYSEASIPSDGDALAVLEVNAGEAARLGIGPGTQLIHPAFRAAPPEYRCAAPG